MVTEANGSAAVFCNGCGALAPMVPGRAGSHHRVARRAAAAAGYVHRGGYDDRCPHCAVTADEGATA